jgi:hypothetical protein
MKVAIYKNLFGFSRFLICIDKKELFVNNSFLNVDIALVAMEKSTIDRRELWLSQITAQKIEEQDLNTYIHDNEYELEEIKKKLENKNIIYSWLQMLQLLILEQINPDIDNNIQLLNKFYKETIEY